MCLNNERRDDYRKDIYERIQLRSEETKYKRIDERNRILKEKIGEFVRKISFSKRCKKLMKRKILRKLTNSTNSNDFFQKHSVSEFLEVLLENTQGQNNFEHKEFNILRKIEITLQDKDLFHFINDRGVRGRKKKIFKTNR